MSLFSIYTLTDPRDLSVRYVGATSDIQQRLSGHLAERYVNPRKVAWIKELIQLGLAPQMEIVEEVADKAIAIVREKYWIDFFSSEEEPLLNAIAGRPSGMRRTPAEVDAMIEEYKRTGKRPPEWTRQSLSQNLRKRRSR
jgi:predicted GIY-YIG superfamily endonuclease